MTYRLDHIEKKSPLCCRCGEFSSYGETSDFASVLDEQMHMGMQNAMRLFGSDSVYAKKCNGLREVQCMHRNSWIYDP